MDLTKLMELDKTYYMNTFGQRNPVFFERGEGVYLYDSIGNKYLDFFSGIAVNSCGHSHPYFVEGLCNQIKKLIHTSNLYYIKNQTLLAKTIVENSCADKVFFANSGAEANEGAIKLAKIYFYKQGKPHKNEFITLKNSFHGRTLATLAATGQEKYQKPYGPLIHKFIHAPINDIDALKSLVTDNTAGIILEPIQGEGGVYEVDKEFAKAVRKLCDEKEILLIFDEVQTGMGRLGYLFGYEYLETEPDIFTLAKALGNGIPIGAICAKDFVAKSFSPGDHGSTFGGNPLATCAGLLVFDIIKKENLVENAKNMGNYFMEKLQKIPQVKQVRGCGLMIGLSVDNAKEIQKKLFLEKILVGAVGDETLRILPPLIVKKEEIDLFINAFKKVLGGNL